MKTLKSNRIRLALRGGVLITSLVGAWIALRVRNGDFDPSVFGVGDHVEAFVTNETFVEFDPDPSVCVVVLGAGPTAGLFQLTEPHAEGSRRFPAANAKFIRTTTTGHSRVVLAFDVPSDPALSGQEAELWWETTMHDEHRDGTVDTSPCTGGGPFRIASSREKAWYPWIVVLSALGVVASVVGFVRARKPAHEEALADYDDPT